MGKLLVPDTVAALVRSLHPELKKKVRASFRRILDDPQAGKKLVDELEGLRSFRIGRFRVIYRVEEKKNIAAVAVGPRETIYEDTYRTIKKQE
jgi:mRNA interferase RelE/StbE